jgi:methylase of polypeptide subunit release factors
LGYKQYLGLRSFDQWRKKGVYIAQLETSLVPYYNVFVPTQFEYLQLFTTQLERYAANFVNSMGKEVKSEWSILDVGCGTGVLGFIAHKIVSHCLNQSSRSRRSPSRGQNNRGISLHLTDVNPEAVACAKFNSEKLGILSEAILCSVYPRGDNATEQQHDAKTPLVRENDESKSRTAYDLIIANPPYLRTDNDDLSLLDQGSYDLRGEMIDSILNHLSENLSSAPHARLFLLYSDLSQRLGLEEVERSVPNLCVKYRLKIHSQHATKARSFSESPIVSKRVEGNRSNVEVDGVEQNWERAIKAIRNSAEIVIYEIGLMPSTD